MNPSHDLPRLSDLMTRDIMTLKPDQEILQAMDLLVTHRLSGAPVIDASGILVGMLSKKDCLQAALNASYYQEWGGKVRDYMTVQVSVLPPDMDVLEAAAAFQASPYRRFPILQEGRLVGQVSRLDLLRALALLWR